MQMKQKWYNSVINELEKCLMAHFVPLNFNICAWVTLKDLHHYTTCISFWLSTPCWVKLQSAPLKTTPDQLSAFDFQFSLSQFARRLRWACPRQRWWLVHPIWKHRWPPASLLMENHPAPSGVYVCVRFYMCLTTNQPMHLFAARLIPRLMCAGGRRGCREKWPLENTETQTGRSPFRVTTFWFPTKTHTRRHSPVSPATMRKSSLTVSPSIFSVSLSHTQVHNYKCKIR